MSEPPLVRGGSRERSRRPRKGEKTSRLPHPVPGIISRPLHRLGPSSTSSLRIEGPRERGFRTTSCFSRIARFARPRRTVAQEKRKAGGSGGGDGRDRLKRHDIFVPSPRGDKQGTRRDNLKTRSPQPVALQAVSGIYRMRRNFDVSGQIAPPDIHPITLPEFRYDGKLSPTLSSVSYEFQTYSRDAHCGVRCRVNRLYRAC